MTLHMVCVGFITGVEYKTSPAISGGDARISDGFDRSSVLVVGVVVREEQDTGHDQDDHHSPSAEDENLAVLVLALESGAHAEKNQDDGGDRHQRHDHPANQARRRLPGGFAGMAMFVMAGRLRLEAHGDRASRAAVLGVERGRETGLLLDEARQLTGQDLRIVLVRVLVEHERDDRPTQPVVAAGFLDQARKLLGGLGAGPTDDLIPREGRRLGGLAPGRSVFVVQERHGLPL